MVIGSQQEYAMGHFPSYRHGGVVVKLSSAQQRALKNGGAITISPKMLVDGGKHILEMGEKQAKKFMSAMKRGKGLRVKQGDGFSMKHLGHSISKGVSDAGKDIGSALTSKEGKIAVKGLVDVGLPVALGGLGELVGGPAGAMAGAAAGSMASKELDSHSKQIGYGMMKRGRPRKKDLVRSAIDDIEDLGYIIKSKEGGKLKGIAKKVSKGARKASSAVIGKKATRAIEPVLDKAYKSKAAQAIGKQIVEQGATAIGTAIGAYVGGPEGAIMGEQLGSKLGKAGSSQIGKKKSVTKLGNDLLAEGKKMAFEKLDALIDEKLTGRERDIAKAAIRGQKKGVAYGAVGYAKDLARESMSAPERMEEMKEGQGFLSHSKRMIEPAHSHPSFSPFARVNSAQMTPYIHGSPQLAKPVVRRIGGMGLAPPGYRAGMGINPPGMSGGGFNPPGMSGGAIYNPTGDPMITRQNERIGRVMMRHRLGMGFNPPG
jgi:hypothetical protein